MKKALFFLLFTVFTISIQAQIIFEKGYYIDNEGTKTDCLIKNIDWRNNPTEFEYTLAENSAPEIMTIKTVKEFGIYGTSKYVRTKVQIDRSTENASNLSKGKKPVFNEEELFLKSLVEGGANLYEYVYRDLKKYFYNTKENTVINQLLYRRFKTDDGNLGTNNRFRQQIFNDLKCPSFAANRTDKINYIKRDLVKVFVEYNECNNQVFVNFEDKPKRDFFNLAIRPSFNYSTLSVNSPFRDFSFEGELGFRLGLEAEFIMPFNKNKWAIIIEPSYQSFKSETETLSGQGTVSQIVEIDYTSIELPVGLRHYFFLNDKSKIFLNGSFIFDLSSKKSKLDYTPGPTLEVVTRNNVALGVGYKYNNRYSVEIRYQSGRELLSRYISWSTDYNTLSLLVGYSFL
jgi:hypothetical protein